MDTSNLQGYWTEGKKVNGTNIGGGVYVNGINPSSATTNVAGSTANQPNTQPPLKVPSVLDSTRLGEKPITLPQPVQNNDARTAHTATTGAFVNNATSNPTNPAVPVTPTPQQENVSAIQNLISKLSNKGTRTQEVNTQMGIDEKKAKALSYEQQAMATSRAYDNQIKAIQEKNTEGQFGSAVQGEIARINRQKNSELADLAILQKVAIDDYNSAINIAQKKIDAEFEPIQTELQNRQNLFNMLQDNMTEKEKLDYQNQLAIDKQAVEDLRKTKSDYSAIAIQNGNAQAATAITNAKTQEEVSRIAATYGLTSIDDQYKKAQINKLNADAQVAEQASTAETGNIDSSSNSILAQTGLSIPAFNYLTQGTSALTRLTSAERQKFMKEAQDWANKNGIDISSFKSQYEAYNSALQNNIKRFNNTQIMEGELLGTIDNLSKVADSKSFGKLKVANVAKLFAGEQVNDPTTLQYAAHLNQLVSELAGYNAAVQGRTSTDLVDIEEAKRVIKNGLSSNSLSGFSDAIKSSVTKMSKTLQDSVDRTQGQVWNLFGVKKPQKSQDTTSTSQANYSSTDFRTKYGY